MSRKEPEAPPPWSTVVYGKSPWNYHVALRGQINHERTGQELAEWRINKIKDINERHKRDHALPATSRRAASAGTAISQRFRHNPRINPLSLSHGGSVNALLGDPTSYGGAARRRANRGGLKLFPNTRSACKAVPRLVHWDAEKLRSVIANQMALSSGSVRRAFMRFDDDRSGSLDYTEMRKVLLVFNIEMSDENFAEVMRLLDPNGDGSISYNEFLEQFGSAIGGGKEGPGGLSAALQNKAATGMVLAGARKRVPVAHPHWSASALKGVLAEQLALGSKGVRAAFARFDRDRSGSLDHGEFRKCLRRWNIEMTDENFKEIMREFDPSNDGEIDFHEFLSHFGEALAGGSDKEGISSVLGAAHLRRDLRPVRHPHWTPAKIKAVISEAFSLSSKSVRKTFMRYDRDRSGSLDYSEFRQVLRRYNIECTDDNFKQFMADIDPDGSGEVSYDEFIDEFGGGGKKDNTNTTMCFWD